MRAGVCLALLLITIAIYLPVRHFAFVNYDDPDYVTRNIHVRQGFTGEGIRWALTSTEAANWFPVTRLSHMLDYQLSGADAGFHHLDSLLIHAVSSVLLFVLLDLATGAVWPAAFAAFVFALHPLHVESVAWVAERKDVLSAFFWFLTLLAYVRYVRRPGPWRYGLALGAFCLGLMSKPMIVTLPVTLLLFDYWPLRRERNKRMLLEKVPFFVLAAGSALVTYLAQQQAGAVRTTAAFPLGMRIANAFASTLTYLQNVLWPSGLAVFYPYPEELPIGRAIFACAVIAAGSILAWRYRSKWPYLLVGWSWLFVTLLPVIGFIQVGSQARADRYMYVPMTGLLIAVAWAASDRTRQWTAAKPVIGALAIGVCAACAIATASQVQYWRNSESLFEHALAVTQNNYVAEHNLGNALLDVPERLPDAVDHLQRALRMRPDAMEAHTDLGSALARMPGRLPDAIAEYRTALRLGSNSPIPHTNLGNALSMMPGRLPEAIAEYETASRIDPNDSGAHVSWGNALARAGRFQEAAAQFEAVLRINPDDANARMNLNKANAAASSGGTGLGQNQAGQVQTSIAQSVAQSIAQYEAAIRSDPQNAEAHNGLGRLLVDMPGRRADGIAEYQAALRINPNYFDARYNLGLALAKMPDRQAEAISAFESAIQINPANAEAHNNLGVLLTRVPRRSAEAVTHFQAAVRYQPNYADAHYNLGVALSKIPGKIPQAIAEFQEARRLQPDPEIDRVLQELQAK